MIVSAPDDRETMREKDSNRRNPINELFVEDMDEEFGEDEESRNVKASKGFLGLYKN